MTKYPKVISAISLVTASMDLQSRITQNITEKHFSLMNMYQRHGSLLTFWRFTNLIIIIIIITKIKHKKNILVNLPEGSGSSWSKDHSCKDVFVLVQSHRLLLQYHSHSATDTLLIQLLIQQNNFQTSNNIFHLFQGCTGFAISKSGQSRILPDFQSRSSMRLVRLKPQGPGPIAARTPQYNENLQSRTRAALDPEIFQEKIIAVF